MWGCNTQQVNCSNYIAFDSSQLQGDDSWWQCEEVSSCANVANNDISGLGVLLAFFITSGATFVLAWTLLLVGEASAPEDRSILDYQFVRKVRQYSRVNRDRVPSFRWKVLTESTILMFSDAHLATGIAVLIAGFSQACSIDIYHYMTVTYLGWISSSVHLVTLSILRRRFKTQIPVFHRRLVGMGLLFTLLVAALISLQPVEYSLVAASEVDAKPGNADLIYNGGNLFALDARMTCAWEQGVFSQVSSDTVASILLISFGFFGRVARIMGPTSDLFALWLKEKPASLLEKSFEATYSRLRYIRTPWHRRCQRFILWLILAAYLHCRALWDIQEAILSELVWLTLTIMWGMTKVITWRLTAPQPLQAVEELWTYGQVFPLLLLLGPLISLPASYHEGKEMEARQEAQKIDASVERGESISFQENLRLHILEDRENLSNPLPNLNPGAAICASYDVSTIDAIRSTRSADYRPVTRSNRLRIFADSQQAYTSLSYRLLIAVYLLAIVGAFLFILAAQWSGYLTPTQIFLNHYNSAPVGTMILPFALGPMVAWFFLLAPLSRAIRLHVWDVDSIGTTHLREEENT